MSNTPLAITIDQGMILIPPEGDQNAVAWTYHWLPALLYILFKYFLQVPSQAFHFGIKRFLSYSCLQAGHPTWNKYQMNSVALV